MKYVFSDWPALFTRIKKAPRRLFLFDLDGTLAPIVSRPTQARVTPAIMTSLKALVRQPNTFVGVISGRSLADVKKRVPLNGIFMSGNHGLELRGASGGTTVHPIARRSKKIMARLAHDLEKRLQSIPGSSVENKEFSLSVHFRRVQKNYIRSFNRVVREYLWPLPNTFPVVIRKGKKVWEIRPNINWNKGSAVTFLRRRYVPRALVLYFGDDATDEDAFRSLRRSDIGVRVGRTSQSRAGYFVRNQKEMSRLLKRLNSK